MQHQSALQLCSLCGRVRTCSSSCKAHCSRCLVSLTWCGDSVSLQQVRLQRWTTWATFATIEGLCHCACHCIAQPLALCSNFGLTMSHINIIQVAKRIQSCASNIIRGFCWACAGKGQQVYSTPYPWLGTNGKTCKNTHTSSMLFSPYSVRRKPDWRLHVGLTSHKALLLSCPSVHWSETFWTRHGLKRHMGAIQLPNLEYSRVGHKWHNVMHTLPPWHLPEQFPGSICSAEGLSNLSRGRCKSVLSFSSCNSAVTNQRRLCLPRSYSEKNCWDPCKFSLRFGPVSAQIFSERRFKEFSSNFWISEPCSMHHNAATGRCVRICKEAWTSMTSVSPTWPRFSQATSSRTDRTRTRHVMHVDTLLFWPFLTNAVRGRNEQIISIHFCYFWATLEPGTSRGWLSPENSARIQLGGVSHELTFSGRALEAGCIVQGKYWIKLSNAVRSVSEMVIIYL